MINFTPIFPYIDRNGRTALHYAAALSEFDDTGMYGWLMNSGYDSAHQDNVRNFNMVLFCIIFKYSKLGTYANLLHLRMFSKFLINIDFRHNYCKKKSRDANICMIYANAKSEGFIQTF